MAKLLRASATVGGGASQVELDLKANLASPALTGTPTGIVRGSLEADIIDGTKLADDAIDSEHYTDGSIDNAHIADDAIDSEHYADVSIDTAHIGNLQVTTGKIAADAIDGTKIADDAIDSEHYTDVSIDTAHIGNLQVTTGKIAADAIDGTKIADNAIDSEHYTDGSIDNAHIADDAIDSEHYADVSIDTAHIGNLQVTTGKIAADAIDGTKLADDAVDSEHYTDGSIDNAHIADDAIDSEHYADGSIDNAHIADDAINSEHYAAGSIDLEHMSSESVDEDNLHVSNSPTDGHVLTARSSAAGDMTWEAAASGAAAKPILFTNIDTSQTFADQTNPTVVWNTPTINRLGTWTGSSTYKWQPSVAGVYFVKANLHVRSNGVDHLISLDCSIYKNAGIIAATKFDSRNAGQCYQMTSTSSVLIAMDGTSSDFLWVEAYVDTDDGSAAIVLNGNFMSWLIEAD